MTLIRVAAQLIRSAAAEDYSQELYDAVAADQEAVRFLIREPVQQDELGWLSPSEWLWFAQWRQDRGGPLDRLVLDHLDRALSAGSRVFRFEFRGLVMRDPASNDAAEAPDARQGEGSVGLQWAQRHAREFPDSLEVSRDALQYATPVAWYILRILTALDDRRAVQVRQWLSQIAAEREISSEITRLWQSNAES